MKIFYDVDTQNDFINADGALSIKGAEEIKINLAKLTTFAAANNIQILGSVDKHYGTERWKKQEGELDIHGGPFPMHCEAHTYGQKKINETEYSQMMYIPSDHIVKDFEILKLMHRVIFEKQCYDVFAEIGGNKNLITYLTKANVTDAVVYGVATDYCVKAAALGLRKMGINVIVVEDAIRGVNIKPQDSAIAINEMTIAKAKFVNTESIIK